jgi:sugar phosphate isomerase/epimerase
VRFSFNCFNNSTHLGLAPTLPEQIAAAAAAGYDLIGLDVPSLLAHEAAGLAPDALRALLLAEDLECFELVPLSLGADHDANDRSLATIARLAPAVGAQHVLATVRGPAEQPVIDALRRAAEMLGRDGARVSVEFMPTTDVASLEDAIRLLERTDDERVGIVLDVWHFALSGSSWSTLEDIPVDRIGFVQFGDAPPDAVGSSLDDCMHRRLLPGEGTLPLRRFCETLALKSFRGVVSVEVLSAPWRERPVADFVAATLQASKGFWTR